MRFVVGISGASGIILAYKTIHALIEAGAHIEVVVSKQATYAANIELEGALAHPEKYIKGLSDVIREKVTIHGIGDMGCTIASGSYQTDGMVIIPCSMATVAAIAHGMSDNSLRRAADVTMKERRPLIVVPRETPFSQIHLENLLKLATLGVVILPPMPAWYNHPKTIGEVEDFIVGRVLDVLKIPHSIYPRWAGCT